MRLHRFALKSLLFLFVFFNCTKAASTNVFCGNTTLFIANICFDKVCAVCSRGFSVGVAHVIARHFCFSANVAYFRHFYTSVSC